MNEALKLDRVIEYLHDKVNGITKNPEVKQFRGGASNLTFLLKFKDRELILRMAPPGTKSKGAHNMAREYDFQHKLQNHLEVPRMIHLCTDSEVTGSDFYLMEKIEGIIPRKDLPDHLRETEIVQGMCGAYLEKFTDLHELDYRQLGLEAYYKGEGYVDRQVSGWKKRFLDALTPGTNDFKDTIDWLETHKPDDFTPAIIHNDFRFDNLVFDKDNPTKIVGILDWELATVGDPLMDVGSSLAYWINKNDPGAMQLMRRQPTHLHGMLDRNALFDEYLSKRKIEKANRKFYYVFGLFRLAGIAQQIYYRYYHKQSKNQQFAIFGTAVNMLGTCCTNLLKSEEENLNQPLLNSIQNASLIIKFITKKITH